MRQIGHRLLLSSGDSTTRVLPVKKIQEHTYEITFEKPIFLIADSLYNIAHVELAKIGVTDFITELRECQSNEVYISFLYNHSADSITPCSGRPVPRGCYTVEITLLPDKKPGWVAWLLLPLLFVPVATYVLLRNKKNAIATTTKQETTASSRDTRIAIGSFTLDMKERILLHPLKNENLSEKEARLLLLLLEAINEVQTREYLMHHIWSEGGLLVVSKNLDVLVSKLRKKLILDESVKITSVHGVGYKLEIPERP